jgi:hypothetical protein
MTTNDFLPFANDSGATNVDSQVNYLAAQTGGGYSQMGFAAGLAASNKVNKAIRQASVVSAALTNLIVSQLAQNVTDSGGAGSVTALSAQLLALMQAAAQGAQPPLRPQGRLTLTTNTPVLAADVAAATVVYYTAYEGNQVPVWSGTQFLNLTFASDLVLTLTSAAQANDIVDVFAIDVSGAPVLAFGPVWGNSGAGAGARGSGAGTTQLVRQSGLWTNANIVTLYNGATTYAGVPANQATYLGSLFIDAAAGQTTCRLSFGQTRKWGVWNAYNRKPIAMLGGDGTASWTGNGSLRALNANAANNCTAFTGLPEEPVLAMLSNQGIIAVTGLLKFGIGLNSTSAFTGSIGYKSGGSTGYGTNETLVSQNIISPQLGINTINMLENVTSGAAVYGTQANNQLLVSYLG